MKLIAPACLTAAAALALAGQASATTTGSCTPAKDAQVTFDTVNRFDTTRAYEVRANGVVVRSASATFRAPGATITVDLPSPTGPVLLEVFASHNFETDLERVYSGECGIPTPAPTPSPAPVPNPPEVTPPTVVVPPAPPVAPRPKLKVSRRTIVTARGCTSVGDRAYSIRRTRTTWTRGGKVVRVKVSVGSKVWGKVCTTPAVAG